MQKPCHALSVFFFLNLWSFVYRHQVNKPFQGHSTRFMTESQAFYWFNVTCKAFLDRYEHVGRTLTNRVSNFFSRLQHKDLLHINKSVTMAQSLRSVSSREMTRSSNAPRFSSISNNYKCCSTSNKTTQISILSNRICCIS